MCATRRSNRSRTSRTSTASRFRPSRCRCRRSSCRWPPRRSSATPNVQMLDHLTVSLAHPDATAMMLGGKGEVIANFSSSPFQYRQQKQAGIRQMFTSEEVLGGPVSFNMVATTAKFRDENPKLYKSFLSALQEATDFINKDKGAAAEIYLKLSSDKTPKDEIVELMAKPGSLKNPPKDWRAEMLFPEAK